MAELTNKQQKLLTELRKRAAHATADSIESAWVTGEHAFLDTRGRAGRGLGTLFKKANRVKPPDLTYGPES